MKKKSLAFNVGLSSLNQLVSIVFPLITFPYVSRVLKADNIGAYNFGHSIIEYFILLASFGISAYAIRNGSSIKDDKERLSAFASKMFTINIITTVISTALLAGILILPTKLHNYSHIILIHAVTLIMNPFILDWFYSIFEDFTYITVRNIAVKILSLVLIILFVKKEADVYLYTWIVSLSNVVAYGFNYVHSKKYLKLKITRNCELYNNLKVLWVFFANSLASTIYLNSDKTLLGFMCDDKTVGVYSVAANIYYITKKLVNAGVLAVIPRMSYYAANQEAKFKELTGEILRIVVFIGMPLSAGLMILSNEAVLLMSGDGYEGADVALLILSLSLIFAIVSNVFANGILLSFRKEKLVVRCTAISAATNFLLNLFAIPVWRHIGAALTTLIAEAIMFLMTVYYSRDYLRGIRLKSTIAHSVISTIIMAAVGILIRNAAIHQHYMIRILIIIPCCAMCYFGTQILFKEEVVISGYSWIRKKLKREPTDVQSD